MSAKTGRRWTLIVMREGEVKSRRWSLSRSRVAVMAVTAVAVLAIGFFFIGRWTGNVASRGRIDALRAEVLELRRENLAVAQVAERLEHIEGQYRQLRSVMGGEVAASNRDILLPPLSDRETDERAERVGEGDGSFVWPVVGAGFVTRSFGDTTSAPFGSHVGVDIAVPAGSYVRSTRAGSVTEADEDDDYGLYVKIEHDSDVTSLYAHNSWLFVAPGDSVETGEVIALSGNSGRSTAPHLHVELERDGTPVDPLAYLSNGSRR